MQASGDETRTEPLPETPAIRAKLDEDTPVLSTLAPGAVHQHRLGSAQLHLNYTKPTLKVACVPPAPPVKSAIPTLCCSPPPTARVNAPVSRKAKQDGENMSLINVH